jgi:hypothetical protein
MVGDGDIDGLGVGARDGYGDAVGCGDIVGIAVEEPPPHAQHISLEVKSSSSNMPHQLDDGG